MGAYVIIVDFRINKGTKPEFRRLIDVNARDSCRKEPGCRRFDVLEFPDDADRILLYEIYDDRAAFDFHVKSPHFQLFNKATAPLVREKKVLACELVYEGSGTA
jgi:(4S)-4-hydroxy-5-phosphonooxypentane-2,3-dione isomerase